MTNFRRVPAAEPDLADGATSPAVAVDARQRLLVATTAAAGTAGGGANATSNMVDDTTYAGADVTTDATPGNWVALLAASAARNGAAIQNEAASGELYIVQSDSAPSAGDKVGEIHIPANPAYYKFDWTPRKAYWVRGTVASMKVSVFTW